MGVRYYNNKTSPIAKDATKIASLLASFKFEKRRWKLQKI